MQPTNFWHFPDQANIQPLDWPRHRTIHLQPPVRAPAMIILEVFRQEPLEMSLVQDDHVIQAFAANTPDQPLDIRILPRTPRADDHLFDPYVLHPLPKRDSVDVVPIPQEIPWRFMPRKGFHDLLRGPRGGGMF